MTPRSVLALAAAIILVGCNKPSPEPSAAAPESGVVDTVAAAGAPIADSAATTADTTLTAPSDTLTAPADSVVDSLKTN